MCGPMALAAMSAGLSATQGILGDMGGMENYRGQEAMHAANKASSIQAYHDDIEAMNLDHIVAQEQAAQDRMQVAA